MLSCFVLWTALAHRGWTLESSVPVLARAGASANSERQKKRAKCRSDQKIVLLLASGTNLNNNSRHSNRPTVAMAPEKKDKKRKGN